MLLPERPWKATRSRTANPLTDRVIKVNPNGRPSRVRGRKKHVWRPVGARRSIAIRAPSVKTRPVPVFGEKAQQFQADRLYGLRSTAQAVNFASASLRQLPSVARFLKMGSDGGAHNPQREHASRAKQ